MEVQSILRGASFASGAPNTPRTSRGHSHTVCGRRSFMTVERVANPAFAFGENWARFLTSLSDEQIEYATRSVSTLVGRDLQGKVFLDIGSRGGLFFLGARQLRSTGDSFHY